MCFTSSLKKKKELVLTQGTKEHEQVMQIAVSFGLHLQKCPSLLYHR
jgi:hypothetical protein